MDAQDLADLDEFRREKDRFFRDDPMSPVPPAERPAFAGLAYYPPNPALQFVVVPEGFEEIEDVVMQTSDGVTRTYERLARLPFEVAGEPQHLTIYRDADEGGLFLPFRDATSGDETYGAGRYLELPVLEGGRVLLDFNYAYHPFCAYNAAYSCPIPPAENRLPVRIDAGERLPTG